MNKANLYKIQNPHRKIKSNRANLLFKVLIGAYEKGKYIDITASSVHQAIEETKSLCKSNDEILEVKLDGVVLWKHQYL